MKGTLLRVGLCIALAAAVLVTIGGPVALLSGRAGAQEIEISPAQRTVGPPHNVKPILERSYCRVLVDLTSRELVFVNTTRDTRRARIPTVTIWRGMGGGDVRDETFGLRYDGVRKPAPSGLTLIALWDPPTIDTVFVQVARSSVTVKVLE
ncbi:MAG: hypothetical protein JSV65_07805 [Armatimonadota bacterium]|nr:MAG: hypothetical protein JSV65_07805 [Armatimonadota bacterium]